MSSTMGLPYALTAVANMSRSVVPDAEPRKAGKLGAPYSAIQPPGVSVGVKVESLKNDVRDRMTMNPFAPANTN